MRPLLCLSLFVASWAAAFAAAPPAKVPDAWLKLIDQLGDDDEDRQKEAQKKLAALGEDVLPLLRRAEKGHVDADVRLRAAALTLAIETAVYVEIRHFSGHEDGVHHFALSPDAKRVVSGSGHSGKEHVARV